MVVAIDPDSDPAPEPRFSALGTAIHEQSAQADNEASSR
jgi:hypothetical protein